MKKISVLLLLVMVAVFAAACGGDDKEEAKNLTPQEKVKAIIYKAAGEKADSEDTIISVELKDGVVNAKLRLFPLSDFKKECLRDSETIFQELAGMSEIKNVSLEWHGSFTDVYGKSEWQPAITVGMTRETMEQITWENFKPENLEIVADEYWLHQKL